MSTQMTPKQLKFITCKAAGMTNEAAAIGAGYSPNGAKVAANTLLKKAEIKAAIKKLQKKSLTANVSIEQAANPVVDDNDGMQRDHYADPMDFLVDTINNKLIPFSLRQKAATDLMPYHHARIGEKGKKQSKNDAAADIAGGKKFKTMAAPGGNVTSIGTRR